MELREKIAQQAEHLRDLLNPGRVGAVALTTAVASLSPAVASSQEAVNSTAPAPTQEVCHDEAMNVDQPAFGMRWLSKTRIQLYGVRTFEMTQGCENLGNRAVDNFVEYKRKGIKGWHPASETFRIVGLDGGVHKKKLDIQRFNDRVKAQRNVRMVYWNSTKDSFDDKQRYNYEPIRYDN